MLFYTPLLPMTPLIRVIIVTYELTAAGYALRDMFYVIARYALF